MSLNGDRYNKIYHDIFTKWTVTINTERSCSAPPNRLPKLSNSDDQAGVSGVEGRIFLFLFIWMVNLYRPVLRKSIYSNDARSLENSKCNLLALISFCTQLCLMKYWSRCLKTSALKKCLKHCAWSQEGGGTL